MGKYNPWFSIKHKNLSHDYDISIWWITDCIRGTKKPSVNEKLEEAI